MEVQAGVVNVLGTDYFIVVNTVLGALRVLDSRTGEEITPETPIYSFILRAALVEEIMNQEEQAQEDQRHAEEHQREHFARIEREQKEAADVQ